MLTFFQLPVFYTLLTIIILLLVAGVYTMPIPFILYTFGVLLICSVSVIAEEDAEKSRAFDLPVARSMLADIARELIARSGTNSQVIILVVFIFFILKK